MSKVDWSLAPDDATHFGQGEDCGYWAKSIGNQQYFINIARWDNGKWKEVSERYDEKFLTARPKQAWSGPEDGLLPVGTACRVVKSDGAMAPLDTDCEVIAHYKNWHKTLAAFRFGEDYNMHVCSAIQECFSAKSTPEQLAAESRETAIRDVMDIAQVDCRVTAARLVDAGFKREVV